MGDAGDGASTGSGYLDPYREAVAAGGATFESLLWKNAEAQRRRFDVFIEVCRLRGRVIADMGAGLGDLAARMHERGVEYGRYLGVEGVPELRAEMERKLASVPECVAMDGDFVADGRLFDTLARAQGAEVFAFSGSLNTLEQDAAEAVLGRAWDAASRVRGGQVVFNFLSDRSRRVNDATGPARRFDTSRLVSWALDCTPLVVLRHEYWEGHDATVWMQAMFD